MQNGGCSSDQTCHSVRTKEPCNPLLKPCFTISCHMTQSKFFPLFIIPTSVKIIKNEVGCRDDTVPKTVETRRHCEED